MSTFAIATLLTADEVAVMLGVTPGTLNVWRCTKRYPLPFVRVGRCIRYEPAAVEHFIRSRTVDCAEATIA